MDFSARSRAGFHGMLTVGNFEGRQNNGRSRMARVEVA